MASRTTSSNRRLAANRANARRSTEAGKATSSLNAVKTGLTGRTVLLPHEDAALSSGTPTRGYARNPSGAELGRYAVAAGPHPGSGVRYPRLGPEAPRS